MDADAVQTQCADAEQKAEQGAKANGCADDCADKNDFGKNACNFGERGKCLGRFHKKVSFLQNDESG